MKIRRLRAMLVAVLMCATAAFAYVARPTVHLADTLGKPDLETLFPKNFGTWRIDVRSPIILPAPDVQAKLDTIYNQVLSRSYVNDAGQRIMLSVAYGGDQSDGTRAHRPEVCYPAQGFQIVANKVVTAHVAGRAIPARVLMTRLGVREEPITYWVTVGDRVTTSGTEQKLAQISFGMRGVVPDGMLIRVSSIDPDRDHALALQAEFIARLGEAVPEAQRDRVFGKLN